MSRRPVDPVTEARPRSPTRAVMAEIQRGVPTLADVARRTGLDPLLVSSIVERLVATGRVESEALTLGCPPDGCRGCWSSVSESGDCWVSSVKHGRTEGPRLIGLAVRTR